MTAKSTATPTTAAPGAPQGAQDAPKAKASAKQTTRAKKAPKAPRNAKGAKPKKAAAKKKAAQTGEPASRKGTKADKVLELVRRPTGASVKEIMKATGWQAHSVRGFISGALAKKMGLKVESIKREDDERAYRLCGALHNR